MLEGLRRIDYQMVGWGFMLWDFDFFRARSVAHRPAPGAPRVARRHHGDSRRPHENPRADRRYAIEVTRALIPELRKKGFGFGGRLSVRPAGKRGRVYSTFLRTAQSRDAKFDNLPGDRQP